jgi:hypothetical protein
MLYAVSRVSRFHQEGDVTHHFIDHFSIPHVFYSMVMILWSFELRIKKTHFGFRISKKIKISEKNWLEICRTTV